MKGQGAPWEGKDFPGERFFSELLLVADRRLGKEAVDDLYRASMMAGLHAAYEFIRSDQRAHEKWGGGSMSKALGLLEVWASSVIFMHLEDKYEQKERVAVPLAIGGTFGLLFGSDGPKISKELSNFASAFEDRPGEGMNLRWETLLCLRTFRALQDEGVPPSLDLGSTDPVGHKLFEACPSLDFSLITNVERLFVLGDTLLAAYAGASAAYSALRKPAHHEREG